MFYYVLLIGADVSRAINYRANESATHVLAKFDDSQEFDGEMNADQARAYIRAEENRDEWGMGWPPVEGSE